MYSKNSDKIKNIYHLIFLDLYCIKINHSDKTYNFLITMGKIVRKLQNKKTDNILQIIN